MNRVLAGFLCVAALGGASVSVADECTVTSGDSIQKILERQQGKRVSVRLLGNDELTGKVRVVTKDVVQLGELAGRDYFDAVVDISKISAVIVRVKDK